MLPLTDAIRSFADHDSQKGQVLPLNTSVASSAAPLSAPSASHNNTTPLIPVSPPPPRPPPRHRQHHHHHPPGMRPARIFTCDSTFLSSPLHSPSPHRARPRLCSPLSLSSLSLAHVCSNSLHLHVGSLVIFPVRYAFSHCSMLSSRFILSHTLRYPMYRQSSAALRGVLVNFNVHFWSLIHLCVFNIREPSKVKCKPQQCR
jgi:hypothetical protein